MKKKEKKMLLILIMVAALIIFVLWLFARGSDEEVPQQNITENTVKEEFVQVLDDGTKLNTSSKLSETKKMGVYEIGNIQLTYKNGAATVLANVINTSNSPTDWIMVTLTLLDKNGNVIDELEGAIEDLQPGESTQLNIGATSDYANAYDFTIKRK